MSTYRHDCDSDFRNEGWGLHGSNVSHCWQAWSASGDDSKYCSNPANKGRACVKFPLDIDTSDIPEGSVIESVTIYCRAKKTDSESRSITVNMLCSDNTSHFTQRTVYLTTDITTQEIGTYTHDPLGHSWTRDRLNRMMCQVFSYCGSADKVRCYEFYCVVNYRKRPVVAVTAPSGTVDSASPAVSWTYTQADGDPQKMAQFRIFTADQQAEATFDPDYTPPLYPPSRTYTVKPGDSLWSIAAQFLGDGELWPQIYQASTLQSGDPNLIFPGEIVTIPGGGGNSGHHHHHHHGNGGDDPAANAGQGIVQGDVTSLPSLPFALAPNDYYIYVRATSTHNARSLWANRAFTVTGASPGVPGGSLGGVGTGGGGGFESVIADSQTSNAFLTLRDGSNIMAVQQADFETLTDSLGWTGTDCTLAQDTTTSYGIGSGSMKVTATSATDVTFQSGSLDVAAAAPLTVRAQTRAASDARTVAVQIDYYDDDFTLLSSSDSESITDSTSTWTELVATGTVPNAGTKVRVKFTISDMAASEVHNIDHIGLMYGTDAAWSNGGHMSRNLLSAAASTADEPVDSEPWTAGDATTYSRVTSTGTGAEGAKAFKLLYDGITPSIDYVGAGTVFTDTSSGVGYTLNNPADAVEGNLLVAYVASDTGGEATPPDGWTLVDSVTTTSACLSILMRDAADDDPTSWTGNLAATATRKRAIVLAYSGAAATSAQFPQENVGSSLSGSTTVQTPTLSNSDAGAWRLSAFAVADNTSGGAMSANVDPPSDPAEIMYVGRAGTWSSSSSNSSFTINRPSGAATDDLFIAAFACPGTATVTAPTGWTKVRTIHTGSGNDHSDDSTLVIMAYDYTGSGSSWSGTFSGVGDGTPRLVQCVAYRNTEEVANQFIDEDGSTGSSTHMYTATVTNTDSRAWRVSVFCPDTSNGSYVYNSTETALRTDESTNVYQHPDVDVAMYDSNGTVGTGSHSRSARSSASVYSTTSWIGLLKPLSTGTAQGADETERTDGTTGSSNPWLTLAAYDSGDVADTGLNTIYGSFDPGSGTSVTASCSWLGFLVPASPTVAGEVKADLTDYIDISSVSPEVLNRAGNQMTVQAGFLGSTAGVPHLKLYAYVGNELISTQVAAGSSFNTSTWEKSVAKFVLPNGTTRVKLGVAAQDRDVDDYVLYDRVSVAFGGDTAWRMGTGRTAHPIFNVPVIEYAEDLGYGYGDWAELPGTANALLKYDNLSGICTFIDQTIVPLSSRKYRAKTISYGLDGDVFVSDYGPESEEVVLVADEWWLKDMQVPDNSMKLKVKADPLKVGTADTSAVFQPLGADRPLVITEGYKGDVIQITVECKREEYAKLRALLNARRTLYLQSNLDNAWWVRPNGDISSETQLTGHMRSDPLRFVDLSFVEVNPEA